MRIFILFLAVLGVAQAPLRAQLPTITNQPLSQAVSPGGSVTFAVGVSRAGPFTYQWQFDGTNLPNGITTTVAGNGVATYSGDGGAATNASLYYPSGVAVDASGNMFIADYANERIREVTSDGVITTVVGNGAQGYSGDGGPATNAALNAPWGLLWTPSGTSLLRINTTTAFARLSARGRRSS